MDKKRKWYKNSKNLFKTILHPGGKHKFENIEEKPYNFVCFNKALGNPVTTLSLILEFNKLNNNRNEIENDNIKKYKIEYIGSIKDMDLH